ncbi:hypothetical protein LTR36_002560 [Oleoguttula mirabilis]|uniref:DUF1772-domain-containing protein n=1 Tax=Oleoguttula mirabilis TaxID=1507867 RepID=A0AAV9JJJ6_9PEZI|nr:hypothetical protein LTR36_002560 [Oleoguttula mirabilis]
MQSTSSLMDTSSLIQTAKLIAVPLPLILAGYQFAFSQNAIPPLYDEKAEVSTPIFKRIYHTGATIVVPGSIASLAASAYLAYTIPSQRSIWGTAVGSLVCFSLWTPLVMKPSNITRLLEISESKTMQEKASANLEARQLLHKWVSQNYVRMALLLVAGVAGLRATIAA